MIVDGIVVVDETPENQNLLDCTHCDISVNYVFSSRSVPVRVIHWTKLSYYF